MDKMKYLLPVIMFLVLGCNSDDDDNSTPTSTAIDMTGVNSITETDDVGAHFGNVDSTDWTTNEVHSSAVNSLFNFTDTLDYTGAQSSSIVISGMPNPTQEMLTIAVDAGNIAVMKFVITNASGQKIQNGALKFNSNHPLFLFDLNDSLYASGNYYRMYYKFYKSDKTVFASGHGDIKKN